MSKGEEMGEGEMGLALCYIDTLVIRMIRLSSHCCQMPTVSSTDMDFERVYSLIADS
jgi:hypothetical protein